MHEEYYRSVGWDEEGRPTLQTLEDLELADLVPADAAAVMV
jgi:aldehyde:ferredoxin oxidoreductase